MAITRTPMVDDDGSGTTGTVLNNAWKQELYNQIDAADQAVTADSTGWVWLAFLPRWFVGGSEILRANFGNHTLDGWYIQRGAFVTFLTLFHVGTDPLPGGAWQFGMPPPSNIFGIFPGTGLIHRVSTGIALPIYTRQYGVGDRYELLTASTPPELQPVNQNITLLPAGSYLHVQGIYKTAG